MKKSKFVMTAIAALAATACGGALVACSDSNEPIDTPSGIYQISFDANGGAFADGVATTVATVDGALAALPAQAPVRDDYTFNGYTVNADGTGGEVKVGTAFTADATVYAQWKVAETENPPAPPPATEYTVTFDLHDGSFADGTPTTYTTVNGKLAAVPSDPTRAEHTFKGYSLTDGGTTMTRVELAAVVFDKDTTVHAVWTKNGEPPIVPIDPVDPVDPDDDEYFYSVGGVEYKMTKYERKETDEDTRLYEYQAPGVELAAGDVVTFGFVGDENAAADGSIEFWVSDSGLNACNGIEAVKGVKNKSVKAVNSGTFDIYVKWYADDGGSFVLCMSDGTASGVTDPNGGPKPEVKHEFYLYGIIGGDEKWSVDTGYKFEAVTPDSGVWLQYAVTVTLAEGDRVKIFRSDDGAGDKGWAYNNYESDAWAYGKYETYAVNNDDRNFVIKQSGKFTFFVKIYDNGGGNPEFADDGIEDGDSVWVSYEEIRHEVGVSTITFDAGEGTIAAATAKTDVYGMLAELPVPVAPEGKEFDGWYTEPDGGVKVTVYDIYTEDTTLYAQYKSGDENLNPVVGAAKGTTPITITDNTANKPATPANLMYEYMSGKVSLTEGDEISFTVDGKALTDFHTANCHGVTKAGAKFIVNETGTFDIYVRFYSTDPETGAAPCWVIEINDGKVDELTDGAYYLVGSMSDWNKPSAAHELVNGTVTVTLAENTAFKIATVKDGVTDWDATSYKYVNVVNGTGYITTDKDENIVIKLTGTYTITLDNGKISITSDDVEEPETPIVYSDYFIVGNLGGEELWDTRDYNLIEMEAGAGMVKQYKITVDFAKNDAFKVRNFKSDKWINNIGNQSDDWTKNDNIIINTAGTYTIYLKIWNAEETDISFDLVKEA